MARRESGPRLADRTYSYYVATGPTTDMTIHARRKRRDHAEAVARRMSKKYPWGSFRVWEEVERDSPIGRIRASDVVATFKDGQAI